MSTVIVKYALSQTARRRIAVATGEEPKREQQLVIDLAPLTPETRALLLDARKYGDITLEQVEPLTYASADKSHYYLSNAEMDDIADLDAVLNHLGQMAVDIAAAEQRQRELRGDANQKIIAQARAYLASPEDTNQPGNFPHSEHAWPDAFGAAEAAAAIKQVKAEYARRSELAREKTAREKAEFEAKRLAWAEAHGSDQLKRGLRAGHTCTRLYVIERAAVEFPGYAADYNDAAAWKTRACPSTEALDERDAVLAAHSNLDPDDVSIVWLTALPSSKPESSHDDYDEPDEFEPCEAVAVINWLDKYDLVKII